MAEISKSNQLTVMESTIMKSPSFQTAVQQMVPRGVDANRIIRSVWSAIQNNPDLLNCEPNSVMKAGLTAAVFGLEVDGFSGQGHLVPFNKKGRNGQSDRKLCQFIPGYKGYITLAQGAGFIVDADIVRQNDDFKYTRGLNPTLEHTPAAGRSTARGEITHAYAVARSHKYPAVFVVLDREQLDRIRGRSAAVRFGRKDSPWFVEVEAMYKKTAIRALCSKMPLQVGRAATIETMHDLETNNSVYNITPDGQVQSDEGVTIEPVKYSSVEPQIEAIDDAE